MPKVSDEYREAKKREIAEAALRAFHRKGFQATSMADIIAESGASAGAIYGSYRSKAEIVLAVASTLVTDGLLAGEEFLQSDPLPSPGEVVGIMMRSVIASLDNTNVLVQLWGEAVTDPELRVITQEIMNRIEDLYSKYLALWFERERGLSSEDASASAVRLSPVLVSVSQGFIVQSALRDGFDEQAYLAAATELLPH